MSATEPSVSSGEVPAASQNVGVNDPPSGAGHEPGRRQELDSRRESLVERFALLQSELGGLFYEMAIRDHLQLDLLIERASVLQRVEEQLRGIDRELTG